MSAKDVHKENFPAGKVVKGCGVCGDKNFKYRKDMEDGHLFLDGIGKENNLALACIFDGHGGTDAVKHLQKNFQKVFEKNLRKEQPMEDVLKSTFTEIDNEMKHILYCGATAAVVVITKKESTLHIYSANCGDARVVLVKKDGVGLRLSKDHKTTVPEEIDRITSSGGFLNAGRVNAILAVSRALGDHGLKHLVISTPFLNTLELTSDDAYVIIACDGVWDVIKDEEAAELVLKTGPGKPLDAAVALKDLALKKGTTDNVTAMIIEL